MVLEKPIQMSDGRWLAEQHGPAFDTEEKARLHIASEERKAWWVFYVLVILASLGVFWFFFGRYLY